MDNYLEFSRQKDAQSSLRLYVYSCELVVEDIYQWKAIIISLHNSLQGFMTAALRGSNGFETWKPRDLEKWLRIYEQNKTVLDEQNQPLPCPQLDYFMGLFDKLFDDCSEYQRWYINWLNEQRNQFIHFNTGRYSICLKTALSCCRETLVFIKQCEARSQGIFFYEDEDRASFNQLFDKASAQTEKLAHTLANQLS